MSEFYAESNQESTKELFFKKLTYKLELLNSQYTNLVDFTFGEKFFYGRVNRFFVPIMYSPVYLGFKDFSQVEDPTTAISGIPFVVDAFEKLAQQFQKCATLGKIASNDAYLTNLKVYKGYEDPKRLYGQYLDSQKEAIKQYFTDNRVLFQDFDEFMIQFMFVMQTASRRFPFRMTKFMKSRHCPISCSGLAVEIAEGDATNDEEKIQNFISSNNWDFYVNVCASYGFMVDQNVPWRLVADIGSSPMIEYASAYGITTTTEALTQLYNFTHQEYFKNFKFFLFNLYNELQKPQYRVREECRGELVTRVVRTKSYSIEEFSKRYDDAYFVKKYIEIRLLEEEGRFSANESLFLLDDTLEIYYSEGVNSALFAFEAVVNQTFDLSGSLTDILRKIRAFEDTPREPDFQAFVSAEELDAESHEED